MFVSKILGTSSPYITNNWHNNIKPSFVRDAVSSNKYNLSHPKYSDGIADKLDLDA